MIVYHLIGLPFALKLKVSIVMLYILCSQTPLLTFEYWDNYSAAHIWVMNSPGIGPFARPYQFPYVHHYSLTQCINHHAYHYITLEKKLFSKKINKYIPGEVNWAKTCSAQRLTWLLHISLDFAKQI